MAVLQRHQIDVTVSSGGAEAAFARLSAAAVGLNQGVELAGRAMAKLRQAGEAIGSGARINDVAAAFARMGGTAGSLERMSAALGGAVSDAQIRRYSNQANALGITRDQFESLIPVARSAAQALGLDMTYALESVVTGVARGSPQWLDNIGKVVDAEAAYRKAARAIGVTTEALTKQQKTAALVAELTAGQNPVYESQAEAVAQVGVAYEEATDTLKRWTATLLVEGGLGGELTRRRSELLAANAGAVRLVADAYRDLTFAVARVTDTTERAPFAALGDMLGGALGGVGTGAANVEKAFRQGLAREGNEIQAARDKEAARRREAAAKAAAEAHKAAVESQQAIWDSLDVAERQHDTDQLRRSMEADDRRAKQELAAWKHTTDLKWQAWEVRARKALSGVGRQLDAAGRAANAGERRGSSQFEGADIFGLLGADRDTPGGAGQMAGFAASLVAAADPVKTFTSSTAAMFQGMSEAVGSSLAACIINGDAFGKTWKKAAAVVLEGISVQAFSQAAYLTAISPVAGILLPGVGAGVALAGAAALTAVGLAAALGSRELGGTAPESRARAKAHHGGGGGIGRPDVFRGDSGPTTIIVRFGISRSSLHHAVVEEARGTGRGGVRVVTERAA